MSVANDEWFTLVHSVFNNKIGPKGAKHFAEALVVNQSLTSLKYARKCTRPLITDLINCHKALAAVDGARFCSVLVRSLADNRICSGGAMSGITALCEMLKTNGSLRELKCAA